MFDLVGDQEDRFTNDIAHVSLKSVVSKRGVEKQDVVGIGFDATCSLVVMDTKGKPLSVSPKGKAFIIRVK